MYHKLPVIVGILKPGGYGPGMDGAAGEVVPAHNGSNFLGNIPALKVQDTLVVGAFHPGIEVRKGCYCT